MNSEDNLRTTPSKNTRHGSISSPSTRASSRKPIKNAKITNFFTKVNSPSSNKNNSNSNAEQSENDHQAAAEELSKDASSSSMKAPNSTGVEESARRALNPKEYVFIIPSSDDDTNASAKGSTTKRKKPPSIHSNNTESSDGFILTVSNNELGLARKKQALEHQNVDRFDSSSNNEISTTPTRSSGRDSRSRDSASSKRLKVDNVQAHNQNSQQRINRIQPTRISSRTKLIDFQSIPSDLNLPRDTAEQMIKRLFLVKMPEDFFLFWEFAKTINHRKPCAAFCQPYLEWKLVGPYDVLSGLITDFHGFTKDNLLRHCRYYYDPPEFQTVITKNDDLLTHYGYYRDDPNQDKPIVAMNRAALGGQISQVGDNLFSLLRNELEASISSLSKSSQDIPQPTFSSASSRTPRVAKSVELSLGIAKAKQELTIIRDKLLDFCLSHENFSSESWSRTELRQAKCCFKTLNTMSVKSRDGSAKLKDLKITETKLKSLLNSISDFKEDKSECICYRELLNIIQEAIQSNDESDAASCLALGLDLFYQGDTFFHSDVELLLTKAYTSLGRLEFLDVLKSHLAARKMDDKVSLLD